MAGSYTSGRPQLRRLSATGAARRAGQQRWLLLGVAALAATSLGAVLSRCWVAAAGTSRPPMVGAWELTERRREAQFATLGAKPAGKSDTKLAVKANATAAVEPAKVMSMRDQMELVATMLDLEKGIVVNSTDSELMGNITMSVEKQKQASKALAQKASRSNAAIKELGGLTGVGGIAGIMMNFMSEEAIVAETKKNIMNMKKR
mmetsp:Transcript_7380/g.16115  ORF Transcript_7380/g.16115 Transcript_7380/m.16115 type:complete len:204 (+) Transcript_7380:72-683(+)|eukprot:CAMPEP_0170598606 /NCGR_PEP_ID=MMETSP0224-20130122/16340_1 /TAXON_ID=285029 /ORGANISM="Togula jolla, Strain CCCM 725" /LENGTH=203 /DNA_ID=CAMNT_0010923175 /DNA_START=50 /DNA_END=661 /DNA_ORIENTATION=-